MSQNNPEMSHELGNIFNKDTIEDHDQNAKTLGSQEGDTTFVKPFEFNLLPEELEAYLKEFVIDQDEAIEVISTKVCTHFNKMRLESTLTKEEKLVGNIKSNMLLIGPTGVGKTFIIKLIANKLGVPFVKADATKFSETGYVGGDVEDLVRELVHEADGDIHRAEYGIVYLDEIDKIAARGQTVGPDVSRTGVQRNLLKLMEEAEVDLKPSHDLASQMEAAMEAQRTGKVTRKKINTKNILFIVSGAFGGIKEIVSKRMNLQVIGFDNAENQVANEDELLTKIRTEDLIEYGFESEFVGRLPVRVVLKNLDENGLYKILSNKNSSVVLGKKLDFKAYGITLDFDDMVLRTLAARAFKEKTGARGLISVFEDVLIKFEKVLPSTEVKSLLVNTKVLENPDSILNELLIKDAIDSFKKEMLLKNEVYIDFTTEAVELLFNVAKENKMKVKSLALELFKDYPYAIKLMKKNDFVITAEAIANPTGYMDKYIKENFTGN